jgi:hypothetical protein
MLVSLFVMIVLMIFLIVSRGVIGRYFEMSPSVYSVFGINIVIPSCSVFGMAPDIMYEFTVCMSRWRKLSQVASLIISVVIPEGKVSINREHTVIFLPIFQAVGICPQIIAPYRREPCRGELDKAAARVWNWTQLMAEFVRVCGGEKLQYC